MTPLDSITRAAQRRLGAALRSRVAGDDAPERAAVIWGRPGDRWFGSEDPVWRVHADASMFPGGVAALLLQSLHPGAMAGVAGHSGYRGDPWGRLQRTSHFLATTTFGTIDDAEDAIARVRGIHERVRGRDHRGRPYRASDPNLLGWVHVAEATSFLTAYQRFSATPLSSDEADTYVAQSAIVAERLGARDMPTDVASLGRALDAYRPELEATPAARDAARFLLLDPPLPLA
ncbi:MAG: oxygenase MpaB family protein, partial [Dermatophilaceae bacterium]